MKVLFYTTYNFNTEVIGPILESIQRHIHQGDDVEVVSCRGSLKSCQVNPNHGYFTCRTCISTFSNALSCVEGKFSHIYLDEIDHGVDIERTLQLMDFSSLDNFKEVRYEDFDIGFGLISSLISILRNPKPDVNENRTLLQNQWHAAIHVYESIKHLIDKNKYDEVFVFNGRMALLRACMRACEFKKTKFNVLEVGKDSKTFAIYPGAMPHTISFYTNKMNQMWDEAEDDKVAIAEAYFLRRSQGNEATTSRFLADQAKGLLPDSWDESKMNIAVFTTSEDEFAAIGKEWENPIYDSQVDGVRKIAADLLNTQFKIYVRIHPNLKGIANSSIVELFEIKSPNIEIIPADSPVSSYALMKNANKVVAFASSMGIEATAFGKVSILAGKSLYMELDGTYNPSSHNEVMTLLLDPNIPPKPKIGALKFGYYYQIFGESYKYFERIDPFTAIMNHRKFSADFIYILVRKFGRFLRLRREAKMKERNLTYLKTLASK